MTVAFIDANVLYAASVRDLLLWLAAEQLFRPRWTDEVHDEWIRNVLANHPDVDPSRLARTRQVMDGIDPDCIVEGYEALIPSLTLPDAGDRHVLAAAIHARADVIVTYNLSDFPASVLAPVGLRALHPDNFACDLFDEQPENFVRATAKHRANLQRPAKTVEEYFATMSNRGLVRLVGRLRRYSEQI
jgi:hypothetical protein